MKAKVISRVESTLETTGLPWSIDQGTRHFKILLGRRLVGILPLNGANDTDRSLKNIIAQIRRAAKEMNP